METLAARAYMSRRTFDRRFRSLTGSAPAAVADHPAGAAGAAAAGDLRLLGGRGRGALRLPLAGGPARALPPPAGLVPGRVPGGVPRPASAGRAAQDATDRTARRRPAGPSRGARSTHPVPLQARRTAAASAVGPPSASPRPRTGASPSVRTGQACRDSAARRDAGPARGRAAVPEPARPRSQDRAERRRAVR